MREKKCDILVLGSGAAGMMAALKGAEMGRKVVIIEKGVSISCSNAARSGGPALANTVCQEREESIVSEEQLYQHMYQFSRGTIHAGLLRKAIGKGREVENYFIQNGVTFKLREDTYGVGFRARLLFQTVGLKRWKPLQEALENTGGSIAFQSLAEKILTNVDGSIKGVVVRNLLKGQEEIYYTQAVIVATGGYLGNPKMLWEHFGKVCVNALGSKLSDGTGINMVLDVGGIKDRNWGICSNEFGGFNSKLGKNGKRFSGNLVFAICGGLLVNNKGERFMNEQYMSDQPLSLGGEITLREQKFYAVLDADMYNALYDNTLYEFYGKPEKWYVGRQTFVKKFQMNREDLSKDMQEGWAGSDESLEVVAKQFHLLNLKQTVEKYNSSCSKKQDIEFLKENYLLKPIMKAPFYIFEYEPSAWCTIGGIKTDASCRAIDENQKIIKGVYVAGMDNGSCYSVPYFDNEGAALGIALTTGIVAGESAAEYVNKMKKLQEEQ